MSSDVILAVAVIIVGFPALALMVSHYWTDCGRQTDGIRSARYCPACGRELAELSQPCEYDPHTGEIMSVRKIKSCPIHGQIEWKERTK